MMTLTTFKGHIVDVVNRRIFDGEMLVEGETIKEVREAPLPDDGRVYPYMMPGFIDSHVHVESSMMVPREFARVAVGHGTIGVVADPHEIGNVLGVAGVDFMIESSRRVLFNFCFGAPSCVPSCGSDIETSGAVIDSHDIERLMENKDIGFLAEMMNYPGVLNGDKEVLAKIDAARRNGKPVDGHAPGVTGEDRIRYAQAGVSTDHECSTIEEGRSCIEAGMKVLIREGSAAKDYQKLSPLLAEAPGEVMLCTDDCHPDDLVRGHINAIVKRALADGYDFWDIMQVACVNPQRHYGLNWGLLREGDPATFIVVNNTSAHFRVENTVIRGTEVYSYNSSLGSIHSRTRAFDENRYYLNTYPNHFVATPITTDDIRLDLKSGDTVHIIHAYDGSLLTTHEVVKVTGDPMSDSHYPWNEVQKVVAYNRYQPGAKPVVGLVRGFGLSHGAMAASVAHDCHNIVAIGSNDEVLVAAINRVVEMQGGQAVITDEEMLDLALPIAGLMSPLDGHEVAYRCRQLCDMVERAGCTMKAPFITMAFLCLPVIPELKITDKHLWDSCKMTVVPMKQQGE